MIFRHKSGCSGRANEAQAIGRCMARSFTPNIQPPRVDAAHVIRNHLKNPSRVGKKYNQFPETIFSGNNVIGKRLQYIAKVRAGLQATPKEVHRRFGQANVPVLNDFAFAPQRFRSEQERDRALGLCVTSFVVMVAEDTASLQMCPELNVKAAAVCRQCSKENCCYLGLHNEWQTKGNELLHFVPVERFGPISNFKAMSRF